MTGCWKRVTSAKYLAEYFALIHGTTNINKCIQGHCNSARIVRGLEAHATDISKSIIAINKYIRSIYRRILSMLHYITLEATL